MSRCTTTPLSKVRACLHPVTAAVRYSRRSIVPHCTSTGDPQGALDADDQLETERKAPWYKDRRVGNTVASGFVTLEALSSCGQYLEAGHQTTEAQRQTRLLQKDPDLTGIAAVLRASGSKQQLSSSSSSQQLQQQQQLSAAAHLLHEHSGLDVHQIRGLNNGLRKAMPIEVSTEVKEAPFAAGRTPFASATYRQQQQQQTGGTFLCLPSMSESFSLRFVLFLIALIGGTIGFSVFLDDLLMPIRRKPSDHISNQGLTASSCPQSPPSAPPAA